MSAIRLCRSSESDTWDPQALTASTDCELSESSYQRPQREHLDRQVRLLGRRTLSAEIPGAGPFVTGGGPDQPTAPERSIARWVNACTHLGRTFEKRRPTTSTTAKFSTSFRMESAAPECPSASHIWPLMLRAFILDSPIVEAYTSLNPDRNPHGRAVLLWRIRGIMSQLSGPEICVHTNHGKSRVIEGV